MSEKQQFNIHPQDGEERGYLRMDDIIPQSWLVDTVMANGIDQHYYQTGTSKSPLVLLHGFSENGLCWSRVAKALMQDYDVIMVDARGHGLSSGPETGYAQDILTEDVVELIHELKLQRPSLLGYSNGALTAAQVAATHPELVHLVMLEDPPWGEVRMQPPAAANGGEPWPGYNAWFKAWIAWHRELRIQTPEERIAASTTFLPMGALDWPEEEIMTHLEAQAQFNLDVLSIAPQIPMHTSWHETVKRIECPILLLTGNTERGAIVSPQEAQKIVTAWGKGRHVSFANASHFMHHEMQGEQFDQFITVIRSFLKEH
jgi:pimeloyl-ACP methyl ester carboxylesterase